MTLNYPHEGSVVQKANAVVGGLIPSHEIAILPDGRWENVLWVKNPSCVSKKIKTKIKIKLLTYM